MKKIEPKLSLDDRHKRSGKPFFNDGEHSFFSNGNKVSDDSFFNRPSSSLNMSNGGAIQTKLGIGQPNDQYEQQADSVADKVIQNLGESNTESSNAVAVSNGPSVQTKCAACEHEEKLQKKSRASSRPTASPHVENTISSSKGSGQPLPNAVRQQMESSFNTNFSDVRIHDDSTAIQLNKELHADAFTTGSDIYFGPGKYNTNHTAGKHLLAHELTHVVQQGDNQNLSNGIKKSDKGLIQGSWQVATIFPDENPPADGQCHIFLGGRTIDHWSGYLGFRHLYIDYYKDSTDYGMIEGGPVPDNATTGGGNSGAWVKPSQWSGKGIQWEITVDNCPSFIDCLKNNTAAYHLSHSYHATDGPNSNSFAWWVLNQCGVDISFMMSSWPYLGYDYWATHPATDAPPVPVPAPASP